ncbi:long-chain-fatty-acid--CoA ligase [Burkholderiales bacterium GJ-E10]|nr:long-chain-fatty-acid--CoA ligase [Burkholderiales bacterium GJ-E10]
MGEFAQEGADRPWLAGYPAGIPAEIDPSQFGSLTAMLERSFRDHAARSAFSCMGARLRYADLDRHSAAVAAWLQAQGLRPGDRAAVMLPNVLQYPVVFMGILRAGGVVVNVNPLYTPPELVFQLADSGAETIFVLENFAQTVAAALPETPLRRVVVCSMGEMFSGIKGAAVDFVIRHVKRLVKPFSLPQSRTFRYRDVVRAGGGLPGSRVDSAPGDVAVLQYTGGTTGVPKGAMLTHRNLVANVLQSDAWYQPSLRRIPAGEAPVTLTALPLYHIFALTSCALLSMRNGGSCVLIPNPRDLAAIVAALRAERFHIIPAVNTLFNALAHDAAFARLDFSSLVLCVGGGMAVQRTVAERWLAVTGRPICEGYGLSEASPVVSCNPTDTDAYNGSIGLPLPSTEIAILDDAGGRLPIGAVGEIAARGPQVMAGYWNRPDETAKVLMADGFLRTGDIGTMDAQGYTRIVDRKKDMILVSGFNVYPSEVEEVAAGHPGVLECAAVGVPDGHSGEAVKLFVVRRDPALTEGALQAFCRDRLAGYKRPKAIEFRTELPKSNVGKILRRALRDAGESVGA